MELYKDSTQPVEKRVEDLLARMTLEEKAAQLCGRNRSLSLRLCIETGIRSMLASVIRSLPIWP